MGSRLVYLGQSIHRTNLLNRCQNAHVDLKNIVTAIIIHNEVYYATYYEFVSERKPAFRPHIGPTVPVTKLFLSSRTFVLHSLLYVGLIVLSHVCVCPQIT